MVQRDLVVKVAVAVAVVAALVVVFGFDWRGDRKTDVILSGIGTGGACELGKSSQVRVRKGKQLSWEIENYCTDGAKLVAVGNFRKDPALAVPQDCAEPGADYPFTDGNVATRTARLEAAEVEGDGEIDPTDARIKLKAKGRNELGDTELVYYFDVCLDGRKIDPKLVIER